MPSILKPCPFCGNHFICVNGSVSHYWIECPHCGCKTRMYDSEKSVITAWNTRSSEDKLVEMYKDALKKCTYFREACQKSMPEEEYRQLIVSLSNFI